MCISTVPHRLLLEYKSSPSRKIKRSNRFFYYFHYITHKMRNDGPRLDPRLDLDYLDSHENRNTQGYDSNLNAHYDNSYCSWNNQEMDFLITML